MAATVVVVAVLALAGVALSQEFACPKPSGQFASPENCRIFYQCVDNFAYRQRCPEGSLYDGSKHQCVDRFLPNIKCGPQPTTEAPPATTPDPFEAVKCDHLECQLPYCHCSLEGTEIPGGLRVEEIPQIITITFDGAINDLNFETYNSIFLDNRTNPDGCPIRSTFFVSHDYTNYKRVEEFYSKGHEIAVGSVSRRAGLENADVDTWTGEMVTQREILNKFAGVRLADIQGMRGPHLKPGRNAQFEMMTDYGFAWDSTIAAPPLDVPVWPYSLEYQIPHECRAKTCPSRSFPDLWEIPMNSHYKNKEFEGSFCPYLDQCSLTYQTEPELLQWLQDDFNRHYTTNRAPFNLALSTNFFQTPLLTNSLLAFIDWTMTLNDVYYTTMTEMLQWVTTPQTLTQLKSFQPWNCQQKVLPEPPCKTPNSCQLTHKATFDNETAAGGSRYMSTCTVCPTVYPWVWDSVGLGRDRDVYTKVSRGNFDANYDDSATF